MVAGAHSEIGESSHGGGRDPEASSGNTTTAWHRFLLLGLLVAGLEELITQGVLEGSLWGWIVPTLLAFLLIYGVAFTVSQDARFVPVIATVLLNFILLNGV